MLKAVTFAGFALGLAFAPGAFADDDGGERISGPVSPALPDFKGVEEVQLKGVAADLKVLPVSGATPALKIFDYRQASKWEVERRGATLVIDIKGKYGPGQVELDLTQSFHGAVHVSTVSGDLSIDKGLAANVFKLSAVSGDIALNSSPKEVLDVNNVSGDINADLGSAPAPQKIKLNSVSGDISIALKADFKDLKTETVSGDVRVSVPKAKTFSYKLHSTSGDFKGLPEGGTAVDQPANHSLRGQFGQTASATIEFNSVSGDFGLKQKTE